MVWVGAQLYKAGSREAAAAKAAAATAAAPKVCCKSCLGPQACMFGAMRLPACLCLHHSCVPRCSHPHPIPRAPSTQSQEPRPSGPAPPRPPALPTPAALVQALRDGLQWMGGELVKPGSAKAAAWASATAVAATESAADTAARLAEAATQARLLQIRASQIKLALDDVSGWASGARWEWAYRLGRGGWLGRAQGGGGGCKRRLVAAFQACRSCNRPPAGTQPALRWHASIVSLWKPSLNRPCAAPPAPCPAGH